jgi:hypothetical protein
MVESVVNKKLNSTIRTSEYLEEWHIEARNYVTFVIHRHLVGQVIGACEAR